MGLARVVAEHSFGLIVFAIVLGLGIGVNCGGPGETIPTFVEPEPPPAPATVVIAPAVIEPTPEGGRGSNPGPTSAVIANDCSATLTNVGRAPHGVNIRYTLPLDESVVYLARDVVVPAQGTAPVSAAQNYFENHYAWGEEECDFRRNVQCDFTAGQGEHLGGKFTDIAIHNPECDECREEPVIEYGPWSDCEPLVVATTGDHNGPTCQRTRTVTTIFCDQGRRVVVEVEPCECECVEDPEPVTIERVFTPSGDWSECAATPNRPADCKRHRAGILTITRTYSCGRVEVAEREHRQSEPCECPIGCVIPEAGTTLSWEGPADCESECEAFGDYECADDETPDFWICKAGTDRIAEHEFPDGDNCRNGKEVSHVRACVCEDDD